MKPQKFNITLRDTISAIIIMIIGNLLMLISSAAENHFPTLQEFQNGLINSLKYAVIPYLMKKFFTDDVKEAQKIIEKEKQKEDEKTIN